MSIPSEERILALFQDASRQYFTMKGLIQRLEVPLDARPAFRRRVRALVGEGRLVRQQGSRYALPERLQTLAGVINRHADGYGFLVADEARQEDVYIPRPSMRGVMHEDRVLVRLEPDRRGGERRPGRVVQVLERARQEVIGRVEMSGKTCWLVPVEAHLCPEIIIPPRARQGVRRGHMAVAEITRFTLTQDHPEGRITEILGRAEAPEMEMDLILRKHGLPRSFPPEVEAAAAAVPLQIPPEDLVGRRDLRHLLTCTIDGETARDFDDAVSLEALPNGRARLGVHIADVSHYVREGTPLDHEAYSRGTSVYFPDRVLPMLPARLSNQVCCLRPEADRLTLSVLIEVTPTGEAVRHEIVAAVMRSRARLTYSRVAEYLEGNRRALDGWEPALGEVLVGLDHLAGVLRQRRLAAGSIDFDLPESDIVLNSDGKIERILRAERNRAHMLIEESMLLANRTVATHLFRHQAPGLYRVHEPPSPLKIAQFNAFVGAFGYRVEETDTGVAPRAVQALLQEVQGKAEEKLINHLLLRAMQRAHYAAQPAGHFGLAFTHYTHFTSPIRRYPDLIVHRLLRDVGGRGGMSAERRAYWRSRLPEIAEHTSQRERLADEAEREVVELMKVDYMRDKIGAEYNGTITGVVPFGLFVELDDLFVEGLIHVQWLPDAFDYHEDRRCLVGQRTGQTYRLGEHVRVRVDRVNLERKLIDFGLLAKL